MNKPLFDQCTAEMASEDWRENHVFTQAILTAFSQFGAAYEKVSQKQGSAYSRN
jgi:hypothetical protein